MSPLRVVVLGGGRSAEHEVSLSSARSVAAGLAELGHAVVEVTIDRDGRWWHGGRELELHPGCGLLEADLAFPALHGPYGEDGVVQGVLEALGLPYVGSGVGSSALCLDKVLFKDLLAAYGLPQVGYLPLEHDQALALAGGEPGAIERAAGVGLPAFVKPARMGSSLGIVKVQTPAELPAAAAQALRFDTKLIVEQGVSARELECGVLGAGEGTVVSPVGEVQVGAGWYDFNAKYRPGGMELVVPAALPPQLAGRAGELALEVCRRVGVRDLARVDFFLCGEQLLVNELNTMPGFTPTSVYPRLFEADGLRYGQLLARLCELALERANPTAASAVR